MPISLEPQKKPVNWIALIAVVIAMVIIVGGAYFLFFAPVPGIEAIIPSEQKLASRISKLELNTQPAVEAFTAGRLKQYAAPLTVGQVGRTNPFIKF